jgi:hypothetical protein
MGKNGKRKGREKSGRTKWEGKVDAEMGMREYGNGRRKWGQGRGKGARRGVKGI